MTTGNESDADPAPVDPHTLARWRLVLGKTAEQHGINCGGDGDAERVEELVGFLFEPGGEGNGGGRGGRGGRGRSASRAGGSGGPQLTVPDWVDAVNELFPNQSREVMQKELVKRRGIAELMEKPELLEKIEPNMELVKTLLTHQGLLNEKTRVLARKIIDQVVEELKRKMQVQVEQAITGAIRRDRHSPRKVFRNLDLKTTLRRNLKNYSAEKGKLLVDQVYFYAAERKKKPWHVIVVVDQSGSMLESAIFSAVMASIFAELPAVKASLVLFDTEVVDLSDQVGQPVDVLLSIQLGGGTDITKGLMYANELVRQPQRTIVVLITDFYEGRPEADLVAQTRLMADGGVRMIGLGALGYDARPSYNKDTAGKCRKAGMDILVCTPEKLAECMAQIIRG
ncbi:VWA domain-containing protein [Gemmata sp. JC717]|uniref:VWA domain-containing protein n=1 Tax=Gemmata algarum TaxID=2975278 RepID=UPI0021BAF906|nr:VWA domain-containing protein [Gemmata algarum]MDY3553821.1 VWA domain-containing protein [Gemmata algarum]